MSATPSETPPMSRLAVGLLVGWMAGASAEDDAVFAAMADEMDRSVRELRLEEEPRPYFVQYRVTDAYGLSMAASAGSLTQRGEGSYRRGNVQVRVGDYDLDSSLVQRFGQAGSRLQRYYRPQSFELPVDDSYPDLRRALWLATDIAYKRALEDFAVKQADAEAKIDRDGLPDFWRVPPATVDDLGPPLAFDPQRAAELLAVLSRRLGAHPAIQDSVVSLVVSYRHVRFLNSEGSRFERTVPEITLTAAARAQAEDGAVLWDYELHKVADWGQLPDGAELERQIAGLGERLAAARGAERLDNYVGPILFRAQAAAVLFATVFASQLSSVPPMVASEPAVKPWVADLEQRAVRFGRKLGARVLPRGARLVDDPKRREWRGRPLVGGYGVDDDGVPAKPTVLVEDGRLERILATRVPMYGTSGTSGNCRGGFPQPSNLILESSEAASEKELDILLDELRIDAGADYVVVVERMAVPEAQRRLESIQSMAVFNYGNRLPEVLVAYKVYPDGRRQRVRNLHIEPFAVREFRRLEAIGDDPEVYTLVPQFPAGGYYLSGVSGRMEAVSYVVPSLLFEELAVADSKVMDQRLPVLPRPAASP